ncbi:hypothetical protein [Clostridium thermosuccinogenes]|uniref:hypothetical protein n=1 Tax=Clostridium thermosuccinogenes TaxID=84032 RepID=UPI001A9A6B13|nr:hypothetical protein [Pseudoclostridium thermosuccinogenes]
MNERWYQSFTLILWSCSKMVNKKEALLRVTASNSSNPFSETGHVPGGSLFS